MSYLIHDTTSNDRRCATGDMQCAPPQPPGPRAVIDQAAWDAVKAGQRAVRLEIAGDPDGNALNRAHRRAFLLSGLLNCGCCDGQFTIMAKDRYGCATHRGKGTCDNTRTILRARIEQRVLAGLKDRLLAPDLVTEFMRAYAEEMALVERHAAEQRRQLTQQLADVERRLEGVIRAIEGGAWRDTLRQRLAELETRRATVQQQMSETSQPILKILHTPTQPRSTAPRWPTWRRC